MSCLIGENIIICGNFSELTRQKPENHDKAYKCIIPYPFKWRVKIGKIKCNCKEVEEHFQPWYGFDWYHMDNCSIIKHIKAHPGIQNLSQYENRNLRKIASSD